MLDPRADPHAVIARIAQARLVLTESLHGAILADTYGIPWRVFGTSGNFGSTKFLDWCRSLEIPFTLTYVPPPSAAHILEHGRGPCVWGQTVQLKDEDATAAFHNRVTPASPPGLRARLKSQIRRHKILQPLLGYRPSRTAASLAALAKEPVQLSKESVRERLQQRLMARLDDLRARRRA